MILPLISTRMKQPSELTCLRIYPGKIWSLVLIAMVTGESQVIQLISPAMLPGLDVLDMVLHHRRFIVNMTVFTTPLGAFEYHPAERRTHIR